MELLKSFWRELGSLWPTAVAILGVMLAIFVGRFIADRRYKGGSRRPVARQVVTLLLSLIGLLVVVLALPVSETVQGQLLGLIGILLSAAIALSSTTFVGNVLAGMMMRAVRSFRPGDFISVGEHFGRVTEQGLLHVEIQTEESDLTTMPNLYLVTNPVKVVRSTGTIIHADISLGYDVSHSVIEKLLIAAAEAAELKDPFVQVRELGDFSVTYRVAGLLPEVKHLITARSRLREMMLDKLHEGGVEIVSPTFMNTRALHEDQRFVPRTEKPPTRQATPSRPALEDIVFEKAEEAASLEKLRELHEAAEGEIERIKSELEKSEDEGSKERLKAELERLQTRHDRLQSVIKHREQEKQK
jgi:small conductance mechanosensitive channel